jgi:hypothetical protein
MATEPSGVAVYSPKIRDQAIVRKFVSQFGTGYVAISIQQGSAAIDPDAGTLALALWYNDVVTAPSTGNPYGTQVAAITESSITRDDTGKYHYNIGPEFTTNRGLMTAIWTYSVNSVAFQFIDHLQVLEPMPLYETLSDKERATVEMVTNMFGDMYDNTDGGGPHLVEEFQTHWGYERIAQMMALAVQKMNFIGNYGNPPTTWAVGGAANSAGNVIEGQTVTVTQVMPDGSTTSTSYKTQSSVQGGTQGMPDAFYGLTVWGTYIECLRHLRDSYTELPARPNADVTYLDRRDYWSRWGQSLQSEEQAYHQALKSAKIGMLQLSRGSVLAAGGIYGFSAAGLFQYGTYAAQVRGWRFYPAAFAIAYPGISH